MHTHHASARRTLQPAERCHSGVHCPAVPAAQRGFQSHHDGRLITVFSASNYCGRTGNYGAVCIFSPDCSYEIQVGWQAVLGVAMEHRLSVMCKRRRRERARDRCMRARVHVRAHARHRRACVIQCACVLQEHYAPTLVELRAEPFPELMRELEAPVPSDSLSDFPPLSLLTVFGDCHAQAAAQSEDEDELDQRQGRTLPSSGATSCGAGALLRRSKLSLPPTLPPSETRPRMRTPMLMLRAGGARVLQRGWPGSLSSAGSPVLSAMRPTHVWCQRPGARASQMKAWRRLVCGSQGYVAQACTAGT